MVRLLEGRDPLHCLTTCPRRFRVRVVEWQLHERLVKGFEANDTPESDVIRVGTRQLVSQILPEPCCDAHAVRSGQCSRLGPCSEALRHGQYGVEAALVGDLARRPVQHEGEVVRDWDLARGFLRYDVEVGCFWSLARKLAQLKGGVILVRDWARKHAKHVAGVTQQ